MSEFDRRRFLGAAAGAAAFGATGVLRGARAGQVKATLGADRPPAPPMVTLGPTSIRMSRLGLGTGVHGANRQSDGTRLDFAAIVELMRHAYDRGIRFFDLADLYGTHASFREAFKGMDREDLAIVTKMWWRFDGPEEQTSSVERRQVARTTLERFRRELATDYLDVVLLHCLTDPMWDKRMGPYMEVLDEEKASGRVRAVGCSCVDLRALQTAAASPWVDVIMARINVQGGKDAVMDGAREEVEAVLQTARENGKAIIGMKIFGGGRLIHKRDSSMKYAQECSLLDAMSIGFHTPAQIDEALNLMHKHPARSWPAG